MHRAIISLGSNIDKEHNLPLAVQLLVETGEATAVSAVYETIPMGLRDQANFFNAAVLLQTQLTPEQLKQGLLTDIEQQLKRVRQADKNAPRTIDLDISWYDDQSLTYQGLDGKTRAIPDPDLLRFAHVALPIADLLPSTAVHPATGEPIAHLATRLLRESTIDGQPSIWRREDMDLSPLLKSSNPD